MADTTAPDPQTIATYDAKAGEYAARFAGAAPDSSLRAFINALPKGAPVLDLGCGPGLASAHMRAAGLQPDPVDASPGMIKLAQTQFDLPARLSSFDDLDAVAAYAGVWANFSLLHAPRADLPRHLAAIARALIPGGLLHIGMKTGTGTARDALARRYTFVRVAELRQLLIKAGFVVTRTKTGEERGLAGTLDGFVLMLAVKAADG